MASTVEQLTDADLITLGRLLARFLPEAYWDTELMHGRTPRLCIDGTIYDVTAEEYAALDKLAML